MSVALGSARHAPVRVPAWLSRPSGIAALATLVLLAWSAQSFLSAYARHFAVTWNPDFPQWWQWSDQSRYYRAALAWHELSLDPARHWYFPLYPMLGALFIGWMPGRPFLIPDIAALLAFAGLFVMLARQLSLRPRLAAPLAALVFGLTVLFTKYELKAFVEPWTTTPTAPLELAALVLAIRLWERPGAMRAACAGLPLGLIFAARPTDLLPAAIAIAGCSAVALRGLSWRAFLRVALGGAAGALVPALLALAAYVAINGLHENAYLQQSAQTGFEWRLLPLHWVTLMVSSLPDIRETSLSQSFAWIPPGVAGMAACLIAARGRARLRHALVISAVGLHCLLYLSYRDLHPQGLFRYGNYHYLKWCIPLFGLYAAFLLTEIGRPRRLAAWAGGALVVLLLFSWRVHWRDVPAPWLATAAIENGHDLVLDRPPRRVDEGVFVPAAGSLPQIFLSSYEMRVGDRTFAANADFKAFPVPGGLILSVLRPMPSGRTVVAFPHELTLLPGQPRLVRATFFWRWPHPFEVAGAYALRWLKVGDR